jgi:branched-chain amino acid transport system substrate-binding protein
VWGYVPKKKNIIISLAIILVVLAILWDGQKPLENNLKIGAIYALSGPAAVFGEVSAQGVRDAVKYFEEKNNVKVDLIIEDSVNDPKVGVSAVTKLINIDKVKFIVTGTSGITNAIAPVTEANKVLLITDAAGYGLTKGRNYLFQGLVPSLNDVAMQINNNPDWKRVAIIYLNDEFGNIWKDEWQKNIAYGHTVESFSFEKTTTDFKTSALKIKTFKPDVMVVVGYGPSLNQVFADLSTQNIKAPLLTYLSCTFPGVIGDKRYDLNGNYSYEYPDYKNMELKVNSTFYGLAFENTLTALNAALATDSNPEKALVYLKNTKLSGVYGDIQFNENNVVERDLVLTTIEGGKCVR